MPPFAVRTLALLLLAASPAAARTWHITPDGTGDAPTIQAGVDSAAVGDTVEVACGTYRDCTHPTPLGDLACVVLKTGVTLRGQSGDPQCVTINAEGLGRIAVCINANDVRLEGLTFTGAVSGVGSALVCDQSTLTLTDCDFTGNTATFVGGALRCNQSQLSITDCDFVENTATFVGGAVNCSESPIAFTRCAFVQNESIDVTGVAGGIFCEDLSHVTFSDCWFEANVAGDRGGVMYSENDSDPAFDGCVFVDNEATEGGAFYFSRDGPSFSDCTFARNRATVGSAVAFQGSFTQITLEQCVIWGSPQGEPFGCSFSASPTLTCCNVYGNADGDWVSCIASQAALAGNFSSDPLFCDADNSDFTIRSDSPCAPPGATGCGLVGALPVNCDPTALEEVSWGSIKNRYR